jgi:hypothetical protein
MRSRPVLLILLAFVPATQAQDASTMAAQQAAQNAQLATQQAQGAVRLAQQANEQAARDAQQANQQAVRDAQQASDNARLAANLVARPKFSVKPGTYSSAFQVKIHDSTRGAVIYYTTDGWTPTESSPRYTGPITIDRTTTLQAIAVARHCDRSRLATAVYTLNSVTPTLAPSHAAASVQIPASSSHGSEAKLVLTQGTAIPLLFASDITSKTADIGDKIALTLAEDIKSGDVILVAKGTHAVGFVTQADKAGPLGVPGEVFFRVDSLQTKNLAIKLNGSAAKEGHDKYGTAGALMFPLPLGFLEPGQEAEIKQGTPFIAYVATDTVLTSPN